MSQLRSLTIHIRWYIAAANPVVWLAWIVASLQGITKPSLLEELNLRVTTYADDNVPDLTSEWKQIDKLLSRPVMGHLKCVDIEQDVEGTIVNMPRWTELESRGVCIINAC